MPFNVIRALNEMTNKTNNPFKFPSPNLINALLPQPEAKDIPKPKHVPPKRLANHWILVSTKAEEIGDMAL